MSQRKAKQLGAYQEPQKLSVKDVPDRKRNSASMTPPATLVGSLFVPNTTCRYSEPSSDLQGEMLFTFTTSSSMSSISAQQDLAAACACKELYIPVSVYQLAIKAWLVCILILAGFGAWWGAPALTSISMTSFITLQTLIAPLCAYVWAKL